MILLMKMCPLDGQMELLRRVSAANNFVLAIVPPSSSRPFFGSSSPPTSPPPPAPEPPAACINNRPGPASHQATPRPAEAGRLTLSYQGMHSIGWAKPF